MSVVLGIKSIDNVFNQRTGLRETDLGSVPVNQVLSERKAPDLVQLDHLLLKLSCNTQLRLN